MKSLKLVQTGNFHPTCGADEVHQAVTIEICGSPVRMIYRPNQPLERIPAFVMADVASALGYKNPHKAGESMNLIEGEDKGGEIISTPGGPQKLRVLTFKGLTKFLMRSNHQKAVEFQDALAAKSSDLAFYGVAFADQSALEAQSNASRLSKEDIQFIVQAVTEAVLPAIAALVSPKIVRPVAFQTKSYRREDLQPWTIEAHRKLGKENWTLSASYLHKVTGTKAPGSKAAGLTARTIAYGRERNIEPRRLLMAGKVLTYLPEAHLRTVHQTGWRRKNAILSEAQAEFFEGPLFNGDSGRVA